MNTISLHPMPSWWTVLEEQVRSVGIVIRRAVTVSGVLFLVLSILFIAEALREGSPISLSPQLVTLVTFVAPLFAIAVWREEYRFPRSYLAALPVNRTYHALAKAAAGWVWLMVLVVLFMCWMLLLTFITGGHVGIDEVRLLVHERPSNNLLAEIKTVPTLWRTAPWQWMAFFSSSTAAYCIGSAVVLAGSRMRWWLAGGVVFCFFLIIAADNQLMYLGPVMPWFEYIILGPYGLKTLITGYDGIATVLTTEAGEQVTVWSNLPRRETWGITVLVWLSLGIAFLVAIIRYDRKD